jgi:hypothetical protein
MVKGGVELGVEKGEEVIGICEEENEYVMVAGEGNRNEKEWST